MNVPLPMLARLVRMNGITPVLKRAWIEVEGYAVYGSLKKYRNLLGSLLQHQLKVTKTRAYPHRFYIEPTNACNLRCPYCVGAQGRPNRKTGLMSTDMFQSVIDQISPYAFWIHLYFRGEPTLHPDIFRMISYAHSRRIATKMSSNLNLLKEPRAEELVRSGLDHLVVSIDGATQESYETYRVGGSLEAVLSNLKEVSTMRKKLGTRKPHLTAKALVTKANESELKEIESLARAAGADNVVFSVIMLDVTNEADMATLSPTGPEFAWTDVRLALAKRVGKIKNCPELWHMGTAVMWNGAVLPCCYIDQEKYSFGSLTTEPFSDIWNNEPYVRSRQAFLKPETVGSTTICERCLGSLKSK